MPARQSTSSPGRLHAGKAAADDDEMTEPAADRGVGLEFDLSDATQHHVADMHGVTDGLQRQRILGEPWDQIESGTIAESQHEMQVRKRELAS